MPFPGQHLKGVPRLIGRLDLCLLSALDGVLAMRQQLECIGSTRAGGLQTESRVVAERSQTGFTAWLFILEAPDLGAGSLYKQKKPLPVEQGVVLCAGFGGLAFGVGKGGYGARHRYTPQYRTDIYLNVYLNLGAVQEHTGIFRHKKTGYNAGFSRLQMFTETSKIILLVPEAGIEPARPYERGILSPMRLPVSPFGR